jgi:uncharacterized protein
VKESQYNFWQPTATGFALYNGVSGYLIRLSKQERSAVQSFLDGSDDIDCAPHLLEDLVRARMIVNDDTDEVAYLRKRYLAGRFDKSRMGLTIVTSLGCNFDCPYCFENKHPSVMSEAVQDYVIQLVADRIKDLKNLSVMWYGGEPLVGKRSLLRLSDGLIQLCADHSVKYDASIVTNGFLLDQLTASELRKRHVRFTQITIDGPPEVHDNMRPLKGGGGTFHQIVDRLKEACELLDVAVRVNLDADNAGYYEKLFRILAEEGLAGKITIYPGHIVASDQGTGAPATTYGACTLGMPRFASVEREFVNLANQYGFESGGSFGPRSTPCTAVRANDFVIGSRGELYKCWDSVGSPTEVIGHIQDYDNTNTRLSKWLSHDPFADPECVNCHALPVCMGGCAFFSMNPATYSDRCDTFRYSSNEQIADVVNRAEAAGTRGLVSAGSLKASTKRSAMHGT